MNNLNSFAGAPHEALTLFADLVDDDAAAFAKALELKQTGEVVPQAIETAATRHLLRGTPIDGDRWLRLWQLTQSHLGPADRSRLLVAALADASRDTGWRASVARAALTGTPLRGPHAASLAVLAVADEPDEAILSSLIAAQPEEHQGRLALMMLDAWPRSPVLAYHSARRLYDAGRTECAIDVLRRLGGAEFTHSYTARLLIDALVYAKRLDEAREAVVRHFDNGPSTIWTAADRPARQLAARTRGVPPILIATQPKSGSLFMLNTLCEGLDCPYTYVQPLGHLDGFPPVEARLAELAGGGAACVDHLFGTEQTLATLRSAKISRLLVHLRDPRAATLSWCHHIVDSTNIALPKRFRVNQKVRRRKDGLEAEYLAWLRYWCQFQEGWLEVLESHHDGLAIMRTDFEQLEDESAFFSRLLDFFQCPADLFDGAILSKSRTSRAGHFRKGLRREWETTLSMATQERQAEIIAQFPRVASYVADIDRKSR